jgi:ABC-type antimicrobial peptide transport system permease subunit
LNLPGFVPRIETDKEVHLVSASAGYFGAMGIPVVKGRAFTERDDAAALKVAAINETAARFYFGADDAIGRKIVFTSGAAYEIVGVVKDTKHVSARERPWRFVYLPIPQSTDRINRLTLVVRSDSPVPAAKAVLAVRPSLLITNGSTIEKQVELSLLKERLVSTLSAAFGLLALALAGIGLYGVLAYAVARRTAEFGVRMALGATRGATMWLVLRESLTLAVAGIALGVLPVAWLARAAESLLYGIGSFDAAAFAVAMAVLLSFGVVAGMVPAWRAGRLDPVSALRCE